MTGKGPPLRTRKLRTWGEGKGGEGGMSARGSRGGSGFDSRSQRSGGGSGVKADLDGRRLADIGEGDDRGDDVEAGAASVSLPGTHRGLKDDREKGMVTNLRMSFPTPVFCRQARTSTFLLIFPAQRLCSVGAPAAEVRSRHVGARFVHAESRMGVFVPSAREGDSCAKRCPAARPFRPTATFLCPWGRSLPAAGTSPAPLRFPGARF